MTQGRHPLELVGGSCPPFPRPPVPVAQMAGVTARRVNNPTSHVPQAATQIQNLSKELQKLRHSLQQDASDRKVQEQELHALTQQLQKEQAECRGNRRVISDLEEKLRESAGLASQVCPDQQMWPKWL